MSDDQFTKLFKYMQSEFKLVREDVAKVDSKIDKLQGSVDGYAKEVIDLTQEQLMLGRKLDRVEGWVHKLAQEANVKLDY